MITKICESCCEKCLDDTLEFFCSRVELTSVPGGQNAMAHLKKRKLEAESATGKTKLQQLSTINSKKGQLGIQSGIPQEMDTADAAAKRRRKNVRDDDLRKAVDSESNKNIPLPQKKRVFTSGNSGSPARKSSKNCEEPEDDETLIRETEAALKSLSGSWPGPRGSLYQRGNSDEDRYESNFENLFEEKKDNPKLSPSSISTSSTTSNETGCSLKDVISLRGQDRSGRSLQQIKQFEPTKQYPFKTKKDLDNSTKLENDSTIHCGQNQNEGLKRSVNGRPVKSDRGNDKYSRYEPPDFNELVDESSNELEIDMSDPMGDKEELERDKSAEREARISKNGPSPILRQHNQQQLYSNYQRQYSDGSIKVTSSVTSTPSPSLTVGSPFSATSAFRPPNTDHSKSNCRGTASIGTATTTIPPMGPYPASATFVGYPTPGPAMPAPQPVTAIPPSSEEKHASAVSLLQLKSPKEEVHPNQHEVSTNPVIPNKSPTAGLPPVGSPDANSKQYTILQPAGVGSRAASAIQDIAREGVVSVSAVSSSSAGSNSSTGSNGTSTNTSDNNNTTSNSSTSNAPNGSGPTGNNTNGNINNSANSNSITITTITTTSTTSSPTAPGDVSTTTGAAPQEAVMKISERPTTYEPNRPVMSMSPSSLGRGEYRGYEFLN